MTGDTLSAWLTLLLLAALQGVTEFLPISSSGHLSLAHALFGLAEGAVLLDIVLHVGTLVAVIVVYRRALWAIARDSARGLAAAPRQGLRQAIDAHPGLGLGLLVVAASVPTAIIGLALKETVEHTLRAPLAVGALLAINGVVLWSTRGLHGALPAREASGAASAADDEAARAAGAADDTALAADASTREAWAIGPGRALLIGVLQGLAVAPGLSRAGLTIAGALWMGVRGEAAARFSFLLSIPAILGALLLQVDELGGASAPPVIALVVGAAAAAVVGYVSLRLLLGLLRRARFHHFAWYCWLVAAVAVGAALTFSP